MTTTDYGYGCDARGGVPHRIYPRLLLVSTSKRSTRFAPFGTPGKGRLKQKKKPSNQQQPTKKIYVYMVYDMTKPIVSQLIMIIIRAKMG